MELVLTSNDENSLAKIISLAKKLNVIVERRITSEEGTEDIEVIKQRLLNFKATMPSSIENPLIWQREQRKDRDLPFSK